MGQRKRERKTAGKTQSHRPRRVKNDRRSHIARTQIIFITILTHNPHCPVGWIIWRQAKRSTARQDLKINNPKIKIDVLCQSQGQIGYMAHMAHIRSSHHAVVRHSSLRRLRRLAYRNLEYGDPQHYNYNKPRLHHKRILVANALVCLRHRQSTARIWFRVNSQVVNINHP